MASGNSIRSASPLGNERGMALGLALFGLVIMGALVSGAVVISRFDRRSADNSVYSTEAQSAAETGLATLYASWDPAVHSVMPVWDGTPATEWTSGTQTVGGSARRTYVDSLRRLNNTLFLARATGRLLSASGAPLAELRVAQLFRIVKPTIGVNAAVTVQDPITFNGNSFVVSGINDTPPQWGAGECDPLDPGNTDDLVAVRSAVSTGVQPADYDNVFGFPSRDAANDPTITSATFQNFLDYTYATLAAVPGVKVLPNTTPYSGVGPVASGGLCDKAVLLNLGEPFRNPPTSGAVTACTGFFPVVHGTGAQLKFAAGSRGQGTLLVDGDLELAGGFEWSGLIIVREKIKFTGTGNKIYGAVLAEGADVATAGTMGGDVEIHYSACAIEKAVNGASLARPLGQRSWAQIY